MIFEYNGDVMWHKDIFCMCGFRVYRIGQGPFWTETDNWTETEFFIDSKNVVPESQFEY